MNLKLTVREQNETSELLVSFLKDIDKTRPLSKDDEHALFEKIELANMATELINDIAIDTPDYSEYKSIIAEGDKARNTIIESNQKLIYAMAKRFRTDDVVMDLISEGNLGLIEAINSFKLSKGVRFTTYASWYIERNMRNFINNQNFLIKRPNNIISNTRVGKFENKFFVENGRMPDINETFDAMKEAGEYFPKQEDMYGIEFYSIEFSAENDENDDDLISQPSEYLENYSDENDFLSTENREYYKNVLDILMNELSKKEKDIVKMSFGIDTDGGEMSNKEIADALNMSTERVRQIKSIAMNKIKTAAVAIKQ